MVPSRNIYSASYSERSFEAKLNFQDVDEQNDIGQGETKTDSYQMLDVLLKKTFNINNQIILDSISDPGNLGNILRSTDWFGFQNIYISEEELKISRGSYLPTITLEGSKIRIGFKAVKGLGDSAIDELISKRETYSKYNKHNGNYVSIEDVIEPYLIQMGF